jgi:biotin operon repressor
VEEKLRNLTNVAISARTSREEIRSLVRELKHDGASWQDIGLALGVSRQAAWRKYRNLVDDATSSD